MLIGIGLGLWIAAGYAGWHIQIRRIGPTWGPYDAFMLGPCLMMGPISLLVLSRPY